MANWWDKDPVVGTLPAPKKKLGGHWWEKDPVVEPPDDLAANLQQGSVNRNGEPLAAPFPPDDPGANLRQGSVTRNDEFPVDQTPLLAGARRLVESGQKPALTGPISYAARRRHGRAVGSCGGTRSAYVRQTTDKPLTTNDAPI
jgi:hypothetical protein